MGPADFAKGRPRNYTRAAGAQPNSKQRVIGPSPPDTDFINSALGPADFAKGRPGNYTRAAGAQPNSKQKLLGPRPPDADFINSALGRHRFRKGPPRVPAKGYSRQAEPLPEAFRPKAASAGIKIF